MLPRSSSLLMQPLHLLIVVLRTDTVTADLAINDERRRREKAQVVEAPDLLHDGQPLRLRLVERLDLRPVELVHGGEIADDRIDLIHLDLVLVLEDVLDVIPVPRRSDLLD